MKMNLYTLLFTAFALLVLPTAVLGQTNCTVDADCEAEEGFCGRDLVCHPHAGCQEWFTHGPLQFTGYEDNTTAVELSCDDYDSGEDEDANSVNFGCRPYAFGKRAPQGELYLFYVTVVYCDGLICWRFYSVYVFFILFYYIFRPHPDTLSIFSILLANK